MKKEYLMTAKQQQHQISCYNVQRKDIANRIVNNFIRLIKQETNIDKEQETLIKSEYIQQLEEKSHNDYLRKYVAWDVEKNNKLAIKIMKLIIKYNLTLNAIKRLNSLYCN